MKKILFFIIFVFLAGFSQDVLAHQPRLVYSQQGDIQIDNPEISQAFYDELSGAKRVYLLEFSSQEGELYVNILVPGHANREGRYSVDVLNENGEKIYSIDENSTDWKEFWEPFGRDWYIKGPEIAQQVLPGKYKIEVYSSNNLGKYVLAVGEKETFDTVSILNLYWQLPLLKMTFFETSVLQFFLTPFGIAGVSVIGGLLIFVAVIYWLIGLTKTIIKHNQAKTLLLASAGDSLRDEILQLLQKPSYDVLVGFVTTAYKHKLEEDPGYFSKSRAMMKEMGFNIEEIDIEGKKEYELMKFFQTKDIIFVAGGNTFYLLKAMQECKFEKVLRKLLKRGTVYIGSSAGSVVAGRTIKTVGWKDIDKNFVKLKNLKGLNLVPFDIFVQYTPEWEETIKQQIPDPIKRAKNLRILTDEQAILVQGKEIALIGDGEQIIV